MDNDEMLKRNEILIFLPTYNEAENIYEIIKRIQKMNLPADILIVDDNSTDGTGLILENIISNYRNVTVIKRKGKEGIGSAHILGINYAYDKGYSQIITMDADFSHSPEDIPLFLIQGQNSDVVVGTRFKRSSSLKEWSLFRKFLTYMGHALTSMLLRLPYDASGGFRLYRIDRIEQKFFTILKSSHYEFFFESLTILHFNHFKVSEVPIDLPKRVYGHSKMSIQHMVTGLLFLLRLSASLSTVRKHVNVAKTFAQTNAEIAREEWDSYWSKKTGNIERSIYNHIAKFYRYRLIEPNLRRFIQKYFKPGAKLLHAGCGGGEVDIEVVKYAHVTALDLSSEAIKRYKHLHQNCNSMVGNIMRMNIQDGSFDGVYNLGVMEHFQKEEIVDILKEMSRVMKDNGKLVLFWPPSYGLSVIGLHMIHFVINKILKRKIKLHPDEPTKINSKRQLKHWLNLAGLELEEFSFSIRDVFTYVVVIARKPKKLREGFQ